MVIWEKIKTTFKNCVRACRKYIYGLDFPIYCKVHGVRTYDRQSAIAQCASGDRLQLVHVPQERYPFNMFVYNVEINRILGYLDHSFSKKLVKTLGKGICIDGIVENVTGGTPLKYRGCNIRVYETSFMMSDVDDFSHLYEV